MPEEAENEIGNNSYNIEKGKHIHRCNKTENVVKDDDSKWKQAEDEDNWGGVGRFKTREMDNLRNDKNYYTSFGDIVDSENNIGANCHEHGELQKTIFREKVYCIDETKNDTADADKH